MTDEERDSTSDQPLMTRGSDEDKSMELIAKAAGVLDKYVKPLVELYRRDQDLKAKKQQQSDDDYNKELGHRLQLRQIESVERQQRTLWGGILVLVLLVLASFALYLDKEEVAVIVLTNAVTLIGGVLIGRATGKRK